MSSSILARPLSESTSACALSQTQKSDVEPTDSERQMGRSIKGLQDNFQKMAHSLTAAAADATAGEFAPAVHMAALLGPPLL